MKKTLFILLVAMILLPCFSYSEIAYSGMTVFSISTSTTDNQVVVNAGCVFTGVSYEKACEAGFLQVSQDSVTGTISTTMNGYNPETQETIVKLPEQKLGTVDSTKTCKEMIETIIEPKFKAYSKEILLNLFKQETE